MSMVERVAKAIYDNPTTFDGDPIASHLSYSMGIDACTQGADDLREVVMSMCMDSARAAIEAMREPTPEMLAAAWRVVVQHRRTVNAQWGPGPGFREALSAMIDAALTDHQEEKAG